MKAFQRILAVLLCLVMSLGMISMVASAATTDTIDTTAKGSLTIHKYEYNRPQGETATNGTGASTDTVPSGATGLNGVKFRVTKVADIDYYMYNNADSLTLDEAQATAANVTGTEYTTQTVTIDGVDTDGIIQITNMDLGIYLVQEIESPAQITQPVTDFLVSIPMTNAAGDGWLYDVHVFPKNASTYATVTLNKKGQVGDTAATDLDGAFFKLEKKGDTWTEVTENNKGTAIGELKTQNGGIISISDLAPGTYRFTETTAPNGYIMDGTIHYQFTIDTDGKVYYDGQTTNDTVINTTKTNEVTSQNPIVVTNYKPDATKEITAGQDTTMVGKKVSYKVTVDVPTNITKLNKFTVTDAPNGLKVDLTTNFSVKCEGTDVATTAYDAPTATANAGFELKFKPTLMANYAGKTIEITYQAEITSDAITNNKATNTVTVTYNDKVGVDHDSSITTDTPETDLYDVTITKYKDSVADTNKLDGVKFVLYKDSVAEANKVQVTDQGQGNYNVADSDDSSKVTEMTTANGGNLKISGLANGTYYLVETATVAGYNLLKEPVTITVNGADIDAGTINVINKAGFELPQTGGIGTLMFIIIGGVLMAGGICLIVPNKKRAMARYEKKVTREDRIGKIRLVFAIIMIVSGMPFNSSWRTARPAAALSLLRRLP